MRVTILGSGGSTGVPGVGLGWGKCDPGNPKNRRTRPSIMVEDHDTTILVDTSPDLREQLLRHDVEHLDGVLLSHTHADHVHGIDDIRGINRTMKAPLDLYTNTASMSDLEKRFGYVLEPMPPKPDGSPPSYFRPVLTPHVITSGDTITIGDIPVQVMDQDHGFSRTLGFRFGDIAYSTDVKHLPEDSFKTLEGVGIWIIGTPITFDHPTHVDVSTALEWIERINPNRAILCHLGLGLDYETLRKQLPDRVEPAYDGMLIDVD